MDEKNNLIIFSKHSLEKLSLIQLIINIRINWISFQRNKNKTKNKIFGRNYLKMSKIVRKIEQSWNLQ